jgi:cytochrome c1
MTMIKKLLCALALSITCTTASASGGDFALDRAPNRINELTSLQNGAKLFVNYCLNCHSAASMRYNKLNDIGLTDEQIRTSLLFTGDKVGDLMMGSVSVKDGKGWFGVMPPDLSVIARAKSAKTMPRMLTMPTLEIMMIIRQRNGLMGGRKTGRLGYCVGGCTRTYVRPVCALYAYITFRAKRRWV